MRRWDASWESSGGVHRASFWWHCHAGGVQGQDLAWRVCLVRKPEVNADFATQFNFTKRISSHRKCPCYSRMKKSLASYFCAYLELLGGTTPWFAVLSSHCRHGVVLLRWQGAEVPDVEFPAPYFLCAFILQHHIKKVFERTYWAHCRFFLYCFQIIF